MSFANEPIEFRLVGRYFNRKPSAKGKNYPARVTIPLIDEIILNPVKDDSGRIVNGRKAIIRYIPGERSILMEEQHADQSVVRPKDLKIEEIAIEHGRIYVSPYETLKLDYLRRCNFNESNKDRDINKASMFYEVKPNDEAESKYNKDRIMFKAGFMIDEVSKDVLIRFAEYIGIDTRDTNRRMPIIKERISDYVKTSEKFSKDFLGFIDGVKKTKEAKASISQDVGDASEVVETHQEIVGMVNKLKGHGVLILHSPAEGNGAYWSLVGKTGKHSKICTVNDGGDEVMQLVDYLTSPEGERSLEIIRRTYKK